MFKMTSSGGEDDFFAGIMGDAMKGVEEEMAAELAEKARAKGLTSVDTFELDLKTNDPSVTVNDARVRSLANALLAAD